MVAGEGRGVRGRDQDPARRSPWPEPVEIRRVGEIIEHHEPRSPGLAEPAKEARSDRLRVSRRVGSDHRDSRFHIARQHRRPARGDDPDQQVYFPGPPQGLSISHRELSLAARTSQSCAPSAVAWAGTSATVVPGLSADPRSGAVAGLSIKSSASAGAAPDRTGQPTCLSGEPVGPPAGTLLSTAHYLLPTSIRTATAAGGGDHAGRYGWTAGHADRSKQEAELSEAIISYTAFRTCEVTLIASALWTMGVPGTMSLRSSSSWVTGT